MKAALPLFPDLLEAADPFDHFADYKQRGFGIWSLHDGAPHRWRSSDCMELRFLNVIYDDERFRFKRDRTGKRWRVEVRHYFNTWIPKPRGKNEMRQRVRSTERSFVTREEAIAFAEKLLAAFRRIKRRESIEQDPDDEQDE